MKTDDLIDLLARDTTPPQRLRPAMGAAIATGGAISLVLFAAAIGVRPDWSLSLSSGRFLFKFVVAVALAVVALRAALAMSEPGASVAAPSRALLLPPVLLVGAALVELVLLPADRWGPSAVGRNATVCMTYIPLLSIAPLAGLLAALRLGAPADPGRAGAVAGLCAGGIAATLYAAHCTDDSPLFVMVWYSLAIGIVTAGGYVAGRRLLRW